METLRGWDEIVQEAEKNTESMAFKLPIGKTDYVVRYPSRDAMKAYVGALAEGDIDAQVLAILGDKAGKRILTLAGPSPALALNELLYMVLSRFNLLTDAEKKSYQERIAFALRRPESSDDELNSSTDSASA